MPDIENLSPLMIKDLLSVTNYLGESPLWHPLEKALYWIDFGESPKIYRYHPEFSNLKVFSVGVAVSALAWRKAGGFITATRGGLAYWSPEGGLEFLVDPEAGDPAARLNDGAVDRLGRFWVGSMNKAAKTSSLFCFTPERLLQKMDTGFIIGNGIGWSPDGGTMYFTDSYQHAIFAYNFQQNSGEMSNRRVFVDTSAEPGVPDGLTVDTGGGIWSVFCRGWKIIRYLPDGTKDREYSLPVECPTSCIFGGEDLDVLYITSSLGLVDPDRRASQAQAGNLFCLETGFHGFEEPPFLG